MRKRPDLILIAILITAFLLMLGCSMLFSSCEVLKTKQSRQSDSTAVKKEQSAAVASSVDSSKRDYEWWRNTLLFAPKKDTDYLQPIIYNNTQPIAYISEGGKMNEQLYRFNYDSFGHAMNDSMRIIIAQNSKSKETMVLSPMQIVGLCIGGVVVFWLLTLLSKFKIVKR